MLKRFFFGGSTLSLMGPKRCLQSFGKMPEAWQSIAKLKCDSKEFFMRRWQKTTMTWSGLRNGGLETNIPVTDWEDKSKKYVHTINRVEAIALPDREGQVEVTINRVLISPTTERQVISERLKVAVVELGKCYYCAMKLQEPIAHCGNWVIRFSLRDGEHFCDVAIETVRKVFQSLGCEDPGNYRLADFRVSQETYFELDGNWMEFSRWLRGVHGLPILCSADM